MAGARAAAVAAIVLAVEEVVLQAAGRVAPAAAPLALVPAPPQGAAGERVARAKALTSVA